MTTNDAKKVLEIICEGKTEIPKETVFKIIDLIDNSVSTISMPLTYPDTTSPKYPCESPVICCTKGGRT